VFEEVDTLHLISYEKDYERPSCLMSALGSFY
jgi:hypothetical protein